MLLENGSEQAYVWGADWYPFHQRVGYESLINIRPSVEKTNSKNTQMG
jgi:hypothetical protein